MAMGIDLWWEEKCYLREWCDGFGVLYPRLAAQVREALANGNELDLDSVLDDVLKISDTPAKPPPEEPEADHARPGYLGLIVDSERRTVQRVVNGERKKADLSRREVLWKAFKLLYGLEGKVPADDQWENTLYESNDSARRTTIGRLRIELLPLDVTIAKQKYALVRKSKM